MKKGKFSGTLAAILLFGLILRLIVIDQSLWLDEATSAMVARDYDLFGILRSFLPGDFHPPLYYLVLEFWSKVFGLGEFSLRLPSILFGVATIGVVYHIGKVIKGKDLGAIAAILLATAPLHLYYSQEARMYAQATFFVSLGFYFFIKAIKTNRFSHWFWFGLNLALAVLTDYLAALVLPVFWILVIRDKKRFKKFLFSQVFLAGGVIFIWPIFAAQLSSGLAVKSSAANWWHILGTFSAKNIFLIPVKFMLGRISFQSRFIYGSIVTVVGLLYLYLLKIAFQKRKSFLLIWAWLLLPILMAIVLSLFIPVLTYFRFLFVLPAFYILLAVGLTFVKKKRFFVLLVFALVINTVCSGLYLSNKRFQREDWRGLTEFISQEAKAKNLRVIFVANSQMEAFNYYSTAKAFGPEGIEEGLDQIFLMRYVTDIFDPEDKTRIKIQNLGFTKEGEYDFNGVVVWKYLK